MKEKLCLMFKPDAWQPIFWLVTFAQGSVTLERQSVENNSADSAVKWTLTSGLTSFLWVPQNTFYSLTFVCLCCNASCGIISILSHRLIFTCSSSPNQWKTASYSKVRIILNYLPAIFSIFKIVKKFTMSHPAMHDLGAWVGLWFNNLSIGIFIITSLLWSRLSVYQMPNTDIHSPVT